MALRVTAIARGVGYRVRAGFDGDRLSLAANADWARFRFG